MKIVVVGGFNLSDGQKKRLKSIGEVKYVPNPGSSEKWLKSVKGADVIASDGDYLLENMYKLKDTFVTYPYIELGVFDSKKLAANGVTIANTQGSNRDSIVEWTMFMILGLLRKFPTALNAKEYEFERTQSLVGKKVLVVGKGSIGGKVGERCQNFGMEADYFVRGNDLIAKTSGKDVIVNCLNCNSSSKNLLNEDFFMSLPKDSYYVSFVRPYTYDVDAMIKSLDKDILAGAAVDCDPEGLGDTKNEFYRKVSTHERILATPHIAGATTQAVINGAEILVKNIEAFVSGHLQNVLTKS